MYVRKKLHIYSMGINYQTTEQYWVYAHITPDKLVYIGISKMQPIQRWQKTSYKETALEPYIKQYGWDNIKHIVMKDGLTKEQAYQLEDLLIQQAIKDNWCINKRRSGGLKCDGNCKDYNKEHYNKHREEKKAYYIAHLEERKARNKARRSTTEGKIYYRVTNFNRRHPDRAIITPAEAKEMYLLTGYIPYFIKRDDLV